MHPVIKLLRLITFTLIVRPLSWIWPKDKDTIAFLPREGHRYIDNLAHFYENLRLQGQLPERAYLLVTDASCTQSWPAKGRKREVYNPWDPKQLLLYLRTSVVVADSWQWVEDQRYACFFGAKKVQIWHGIPLKKIEKSNLARRSKKGFAGLLEPILHWMKGRYPRYDLLVSTSPFFEQEAFRLSFDAEQFVNTGYPRNDYLLDPELQKSSQIDRDVLCIQTLERLRTQGKRVVVYAPTFRDTGGGPFEDGALHLLDLLEFAKKNNVIFVVKLHPYVTAQPPDFLWPHIITYDAAKDIAPLLVQADLLISDYSSVYFDFLLLQRPIVFFPYDFEKYFEYDRSFLFDYESYTPGIQCRTAEELFSTIVQELNQPDPEFGKRRLELQERSFSSPDAGASNRLWQSIQALL